MRKKALSKKELKMLQELWDAERFHGRMAWISAWMTLSNRTLEALEDRGLIEGVRDGDSTYIQLTAEGRQTLSQGG